MTKRPAPQHEANCECCKNGMAGFMKSLEKIISKAGHAVIGTGQELADGSVLPLSYTVGLSDDGLPEMIAFGLPADTARDLINDAVKLLRSNTLKTSTPTTQIANFPLYFQSVPADRAREHIKVANNRARAPQEAIQMVWPDAVGKFPWDAGFDERFRALQPLLFHSRFEPLTPPTPETHGEDPLSRAQRARHTAAKEIAGSTIDAAKNKSTSKPG